MEEGDPLRSRDIIGHRSRRVTGSNEQVPKKKLEVGS